jgi:hypothetical protein
VTEPRVDCGRFEDDVVALALGTISGRARADVLAHVESCPHCSVELEALAGTTDHLLQLVPEEEPPLGFEVRVLTRLHEARRARLVSWRRRTLVLVGTAALVAGIAGFLIGIGVGSVQPARSTHEVTAVFHTATRAVGELVVPTGQIPRLVVKISGLDTNGPVTCRVTDKADRTTTIGVFWLYRGSGTWTASLPFPADELRAATLTAPNGAVLARAAIR